MPHWHLDLDYMELAFPIRIILTAALNSAIIHPLTV